MVSDFFNGLSFVGKAFFFFYTRPSYWKFALIPCSILVCIYGVFFYFIFYDFLPHFLSFLPQVEEFTIYIRWLLVALYWVCYVGLSLAFILVFTLLVNAFFDLIGAPFFDRMISKFESDRYGVQPVTFSWLGYFKLMICIIAYVTINLILVIPCFFISIIFPVLGTFFCAFLMGKRLATSIAFSVASNQKFSCLELCRKINQKPTLFRALGTLTYMVYLIPFLPVFFAPCFALATSMMLNEEIDNKIPQKKIQS